MTIEQHINNLEIQCNIMSKNFGDLKNEVHLIRQDNYKEIHKYIDNKCSEVSKLRDDAIKALKLLKEKGIVTQEELNKAIS